MFTYQLQNRIFRVEDDRSLIFPNDVVVEMILEPPVPFGAPGEPTRTATRSQPATVHWEGNSGRGFIRSAVSLGPVDVAIDYSNMRLAFQGDRAIANTRCDGLADLDNLVSGLYYVLPFLLNLEIVDPPSVRRVFGKVGQTHFRWELTDFRFEFDVTTQEEQEKRIASSLERLELLGGTDHRRLAAALHYFHIACRLLVVGSSPWELMAEAILNFTKVLQVLFGETRDVVRAGLEQLGYSPDAIERDFIPMMILRNEFDVGHTTISILTRDELDWVYSYLRDSESLFRKFLKHVVQDVQEAAYKPPQQADLSLDPEKRKIMQGLIETFQRRSA